MSGPSKLNENKIQVQTPTLADLFFFAHPGTGKGAKNSLEALKALLVSANVPVLFYADTSSLLANTTISSGQFAFVDDAGSGEWALFIYRTGDRDELTSYILILEETTGAAALPAGVLRDMGGADLTAGSGGGPTTGGSGVGGAVMRGNIFTVTVMGDIGAIEGIPPGSTIRALVDEPEPDNDAHWNVNQ